MKYILMALVVVASFSCRKNTTGNVTKEAVATSTTSTTTVDDQYMLCAEQSQNRISIIDVTDGTFFWNWKAAVNNNIPTADAGWYDMPAEAKRVYNGLYILTSASNGGVALIRQSSKKAVYFAKGVGNMHSVELLPDGNIVGVSSSDTSIMIFRTDTVHLPGTIAWKTRFNDPGPHNVVWDRTRNRLWAAGQHKLYSFSYNNDCHHPSLTATDSVSLDVVAAANAHDLFPMYGSTDSLWITTGGKVWKFSAANPHANFTLVATITGVKSISSGPAGYPTAIIMAKNATDQWNDTIMNLSQQTIFFQSGLEIYKARWKISNDNTFSYPTGDVLKVCL